VVAVGLADGRTVIHNIEFDETLMTFKHDYGPVTAISFRTGQLLFYTSVIFISVITNIVHC